MYFFYVDESGTRDPDVRRRADGICTKEWLYVLTAVGIFEYRWKTFYRAIVRRKRELLSRIHDTYGRILDLDATEVKSNWLRIPDARQRHPFLSLLNQSDREALVALYYEQLTQLKVPVIAVAVDKRYLHQRADAAWLHAKAWELLCERVELYMCREHPKHRAALIADDMGKQQNCELAMRHSRFLEHRTTARRRLDHIVEMPLFVRSELSEGVQLADLCSYSIYRALRSGDLQYRYFEHVFARIYRAKRKEGMQRLDGLKFFPPDSPLYELFTKSDLEMKRGRPDEPSASLELMSGGVNPIKLQAAPDKRAS